MGNGVDLSPLATLPGAVPSKSSSRLANGSSEAQLAAGAVPSKSSARLANGHSEAPFSSSKSSQIVGVNGALSDGNIAKVPGKAPITKVPPKARNEDSTSLMKSSAKR